jgi:hypothetical protein
MPGRFPNLFIIGAPRCATTSVYRALGRHPEVFMSAEKEPGHLAPEFAPLSSAYAREDAYLRLFEQAGARRYRGEATTHYLFSRGALARIRLESDDPRILVILRNPADMMYSLHAECVFHGLEPIADFRRALDTPIAARSVPGSTDQRRLLDYRRLATFAEHLEPWIREFGPALHVEFLEDLASAPGPALDRIFGFLGLPRCGIALTRENGQKSLRSRWVARLLRTTRGTVRRAIAGALGQSREPAATGLWAWNVRMESRRPLDTKLRARLLAEQGPALDRLEALLGRALPPGARR